MHRFGLAFGVRFAVAGSILVLGARFCPCFWCAVPRFGFTVGVRFAALGSILVLGAPCWGCFWCTPLFGDALHGFGAHFALRRQFDAPCPV